MLFSDIREFFWPLLEKPKNALNIKTINTEDITVDGEWNIKKALDLSLNIYDKELERAKSVESKSIVFISALGLIVAVLLAISKDFIFNTITQNNLFSYLFIALVIVLIIYLCRTVWFSIKALERQNYNNISFKDIIKKTESYEKSLIRQIANKTISNYDTINNKVNAMVMAQAYFKRAIITLSLFPILFIVNFVYPKENGIIEFLSTSLKNFIFMPFSSINIVSVAILVFLIVNVVLLSVILIKMNKKIKD